MTDKKSRTALFRQWFVMIPSVLFSIDVGLIMGFPSILSQALISNTTDIYATEDQASWIASSNGIFGIGGIFILSTVMEVFGRKSVHLVMCLTYVVGWIIISVAKDVNTLVIGRGVQGISIGCFYIAPLIVSEFTHPKRRGYFQTSKKLAIAIGTLLCHVLGSMCGWRIVAFVSIVPVTVGTIFNLFWPESPAWLASKGRYEESEKNFAWLNANDERRQNEIEMLILSQKEKNKSRENKKTKFNFLRKFMKKDFLKTFSMVLVLTIVLEAVGKYSLAAYAVQIMVKMLRDESLVLYCTVGMDLVIILGLVLSCFVVVHFKRRTLLFANGILAVILLLSLSLVCYLTTKSIIPSSLNWLCPAILIFYNLISNIGIVPVCYAIMGEVYPLEYRGIGSCASGVVFTILLSANLKLNPIMLEKFDIHGTFLVYNAFIVCGLIYLYYTLPETKDRTLQEIENDITGRTVVASETASLQNEKADMDDKD